MSTSLWAGRAPALALLTAAAAALAACGDSGSGSGTSASGGGYGYGAKTAKPASTTPAAAPAAGGSGTVALTADESGGLSFDRKSAAAKAGKVTLTLTNPSGNSAPHGIAIEGQGVDKDGATASPGGTSTVSLTLKPGTYTFYCPVAGHRAAGMEGTLKVS